MKTKGQHLIVEAESTSLRRWKVRVFEEGNDNALLIYSCSKVHEQDAKQEALKVFNKGKRGVINS